MFLEIGLEKRAGQCLFSAEKYEEALQCYLKSDDLREAGECYHALKRYPEAADAYHRGKDYLRAIECYEKLNNYDKILQTLIEHKEMRPDDRDYLARKYVPYALGDLTEKVKMDPEKDKEFDEFDDEIIEADEDSEEDEGEIKPTKTGEDEDNGCKLFSSSEKKSENVSQISFDQPTDSQYSVVKEGEQSKVKEEQNKDESKKDISNMTFEEVKVNDKAKSKDGVSEMSFVEVTHANISDFSFEKVEDMRSDDFEHLSRFNLKDEFLKSEAGDSVIEELAELRK